MFYLKYINLLKKYNELIKLIDLEFWGDIVENPN